MMLYTIANTINAFWFMLLLLPLVAVIKDFEYTWRRGPFILLFSWGFVAVMRFIASMNTEPRFEIIPPALDNQLFILALLSILIWLSITQLIKLGIDAA